MFARQGSPSHPPLSPDVQDRGRSTSCEGCTWGPASLRAINQAPPKPLNHIEPIIQEQSIINAMIGYKRLDKTQWLESFCQIVVPIIGWYQIQLLYFWYKLQMAKSC